MSGFATDLWSSVFTPGATPTLVVATNVSFAALQVLLFALLLATESIHFLILSVLCGGLWWSINWFVREVKALKEEELLKEDTSRPRGGTASGAGGNVLDSEDTETEDIPKHAKGLRHRSVAAGNTTGNRAASTDVTALSVDSLDSRKQASTENVSGTDSEWEKLDSEVE